MFDSDTLVVVLVITNAITIGLALLDRRRADKLNDIAHDMHDSMFKVARGTHRAVIVDEDTIAIERNVSMGFDTNHKED